MKKLILGLLLSVSVSMAQSYFTLSNQAASTNLATLTSAAYINSITFWTTNQAATVVTLFNGYVTNITAARTNWTSYVTNKVYTYLTSTGTTNTWTNRVIQTAPVITAAATSHATPLAVLTLNPSLASGAIGEPLVWTPDVPILVPSRLTMSNGATGLSFIINYRAP